MSSLDSSNDLRFSHLSILDNSSPTISIKKNQSSWDKQGVALKEGKLKNRLILGKNEDPRFFIAAQKITDGKAIEQLTDTTKKSKYIELGSDKQNRILINIKSVAKRLHLNQEEIEQQAITLTSESFLESLGKRADKLSAVLNNYEKIIENFVLRRNLWMNKAPSLSDPMASQLMIQPATLMKVIKVAFTQNFETLNVQNPDISKHIYEIQADNQKFYVHKDENNQVQLAVFKQELGSGFSGSISKLISFNQGFEKLALKKSRSYPDPNYTLVAQVSLKQEALNLHLIHENGRVWGAQDKPVILAHINEASLNQDDTLGILMPLYSIDYLDMITNTTENPYSSTYLEARLFEFHQLLSCLKHLENIQMVHGDIKLENVFIHAHSKNRNEAHLSDFGGSIKFTEEVLQSLPKNTAPEITSSPLYTPVDEIIKSNQLYKQNVNEYIQFQHKRDVFALGCVLYGALTRAFPFEQYIDPRTKCAHPNLETYNRNALSNFPRDLSRLIHSMLNPDPYKRPSPNQAFNKLDFYIRKKHPQVHQEIQSMITNKGYLSPFNETQSA